MGSEPFWCHILDERKIKTFSQTNEKSPKSETRDPGPHWADEIIENRELKFFREKAIIFTSTRQHTETLT